MDLPFMMLHVFHLLFALRFPVIINHFSLVLCALSAQVVIFSYLVVFQA